MISLIGEVAHVHIKYNYVVNTKGDNMKGFINCKGCGQKKNISKAGKCPDGHGLYCKSCGIARSLRIALWQSGHKENSKLARFWILFLHTIGYRKLLMTCPRCWEKLLKVGKSKDRYKV